MPDSATAHREPHRFHRPHVSAALVVSALSAIWTLIFSSLSIVLGILGGATALVAFGAIGLTDAFGSCALVYHFSHSLRHGALSDRLEAIAHRFVLFGLLTVGAASVIGGIARMASGASGEPPAGALALLALSVVALTVLSMRKQLIARRIGSAALLSDGHLSAIGAAQAAVALIGTALARWPGWHRADPAAAAMVGAVAVWLAVTTWRDA